MSIDIYQNPILQPESPMSSSTLAAPAPRTALPWPVFAISSVAVFLVSLDGTMLFSIFETLWRSFAGATPPEASWVLNAYTIVYAAMLIPAGGVADTYGRKRVFMAGVLLFTTASVLCGLSPNIYFLIAARALQAVGAALLTPASLSIVLNAFPATHRVLAVSLWGAVGGFAAAVGPSLGSYITQTLGWHWAFLINLPVGLLTLLLAARRLPAAQASGKKGRLDLPGMALLIAAIGAFAFAIVELESPAWTHAEVAMVALGGLLALAAFVYWAGVAASPLVDLALFRIPSYSLVNIATLTFGIAFSIMFFTFFFFQEHIWHLDRITAGLAIVPGPLTVVPVAILTGRLAGRLGYRPFLVGGALVYAASGLWFLLVPTSEPAYLTHWLPGLLLSGTGVGLVMPSLSGAAVRNLPAGHYAVGSAVNQATRQIGAAIGVSITVLLLGGAGLVRSDFNVVYGLHVSLALITALLCTRIKH